MADKLHGSGETQASGRHVLVIPLLLVGAYLLRPEVIVLRLGAVAGVLAVGHIWCEFLYEVVASRGAARGFTLHFGNFLLVIVLGTVLAIWWGWRSTAVILFLDIAWQGVWGLLERAIIERRAKTVEQLPKIIKRLPPRKE